MRSVEAATKRFWKQVEKGPECWIWRGRTRGKYGMFYVGGGTGIRERGAHRCAFVMVKGIIPKGMFVLHKCDNPICVNPKHLFLGTPLLNMQDMIKKNRAAWQKDPTLPYRTGKMAAPPVGEKNGKAILCEKDVLQIRYYYKKGFSLTTLAGLFGVSIPNVHAIISGRSWKHLGGVL